MSDAGTACLSEQEEADLFELLPVPLQQAVARGDMDLPELLERVTNSREAELCPRCVTRTVSTRYRRFGLCATCARAAMNDAYIERLTEIEAQRDANRLKTAMKRARDETDPDRVRHAGPGSRDRIVTPGPDSTTRTEEDRGQEAEADGWQEPEVVHSVIENPHT